MIDVARSEGATIALRFESEEADALRSLARQMRALLEQASEEDVVMRRLFPDAYTDDSRSRAYRELVADDLNALKLAAIERVLTDLGERGPSEVTLRGDDDQRAWLTALTDMRLAIGTRLGVDERTMSMEPDPADALYPSLAVLHWLGWLQEVILDVEGG